MGKNIFELSILHPEDEPAQRKVLTEVIANKGRNVIAKVRLRHKNGNFRTMDVIFRNLLNNESIKGIVANYQDITDNIIKIN